MPSFLRRSLLLAALCAGLACAAAGAEPVSIELTVQGGQVVGGAKVVRLKRDDAVRLSVRADKADELHVHGYNLHADVAPDKAASLSFVAKRTGRFSMELHKSGIELGTLEIYPK